MKRRQKQKPKKRTNKPKTPPLFGLLAVRWCSPSNPFGHGALPPPRPPRSPQAILEKRTAEAFATPGRTRLSEATSKGTEGVAATRISAGAASVPLPKEDRDHF